MSGSCSPNNNLHPTALCVSLTRSSVLKALASQHMTKTQRNCVLSGRSAGGKWTLRTLPSATASTACMNYESLHVWPQSTGVCCAREPPCLAVYERPTEISRFLQQPRVDQCRCSTTRFLPSPAVLSVRLLLSPQPEHDLLLDGPALWCLGLRCWRRSSDLPVSRHGPQVRYCLFPHHVSG